MAPDCFWIDGNNDQPQSGFQVHWPEFFNPQGNDLPSDPKEQADKIDYFCKNVGLISFKQLRPNFWKINKTFLELVKDGYLTGL